MPLRTHPDVYEPAEDSFLLTRAVKEGGPYPGARALDLGTGSGVAALALAEAGAKIVVAVDVNPHAARLARENALDAGFVDRVRVLQADLETALSPEATFQVITFNPPYLPTSEDEVVEGPLHRAFDGGEGGVEVTRRFVEALPRRLAEGGRALLVLSTRGDVDAVRRDLHRGGFHVEVRGEERFFFERLQVWEITRASSDG